MSTSQSQLILIQDNPSPSIPPASASAPAPTATELNISSITASLPNLSFLIPANQLMDIFLHPFYCPYGNCDFDSAKKSNTLYNEEYTIPLMLKENTVMLKLA
jgi:hypothetical protein